MEMSKNELINWITVRNSKNIFCGRYTSDIIEAAYHYSPIKSEDTTANLYHIYYNINDISLRVVS